MMNMAHTTGINMKKHYFGITASFFGLFAAAAMATSAWAQTPETWSVKAGMNQITPDVKSGDMTAPTLPGTKVSVGSDTQPILAISYLYNENIAAELVLGTPYKHTLYGAGSISGVGKTGTVEALPPTIFAQYRFFETSAKFRPYASLGLTYAYFQKETGSGALTALTNPGSSTPTTFKVDATWGFTPQLGVMYEMGEEWFADLSIAKSYLKTTAHFSTGQTIEMRLDPVAISLALGRHF